MPFTPFHFGLGYAVTAIERRPRVFCFFTFALTQVVIDSETAFNMVRNAERLHTLFHTFAGSLLAAAFAAGISYRLAHTRIAKSLPSSWENTRLLPTNRGGAMVLFSSLVGAWTHVALDGIMHADAQPFAPWSNANPFLERIPLGALHLALVALFVVGLLGIRRRRRPTAPGNTAP